MEERKDGGEEGRKAGVVETNLEYLLSETFHTKFANFCF